MNMHDVIQQSIVPLIEYHCNKVYEQRENLVIDGIKIFGHEDVYVPGKIVNACSYITCCGSQEKGILISHLHMMREIINFTATMKIKDWGHLIYLRGLYRLKKSGLLEQTASVEALETLKRNADWRKFVNAGDLTLIDYPTNFYGVAIGIARYRELLGWEAEGYSNKLLEKFMHHIETYSGQYGFMDETQGGGRFDRYSLLIAAELSATLYDAGMEVPETLRKMLRKSCDVCLSLANSFGDGICYGRSIGPYGDNAVLEILSISALLGILNDEEKYLAYTYNLKAIDKFINFWIDQETQCVNMWDKGRKTDGYRNKNRILGETITLCMQTIGSYELWEKAGFAEKILLADYNELCIKQQTGSLYRFTVGSYERALAVIRDQSYVFLLPMISGDYPYYNHAPYLTVPQCNRVLECPPGTVFPQLVPVLIDKDGYKKMPICFEKEIDLYHAGQDTIVSYKQDGLCAIGNKTPEIDKTFSSETRYTFSPGMITREDTFYPIRKRQEVEIQLEFATFAQDAEVNENQIVFGKGNVSRFTVQGLHLSDAGDISEDSFFYSSHGALNTILRFTGGKVLVNEPLKVKWVIKYK